MPTGASSAGLHTRRIIVLAGSALAAVAVGGTVVALLLLPGSGGGTGAQPPASSSRASTSQSGYSSAGSSGGTVSGTNVSGIINAGGSTFQANFQQDATHSFQSADPGVTVNYSSEGSSAGRSDLASGAVLFAGTDTPIPAAEQAKYQGKTVLYFPVQVGPIAIAYNLTGVTGLKLDAPTLAGIFQGTIKTWDDPAIKAQNPGASLPGTPITPVVRSDGSGTTQNFSLFFEDAAPSEWKLGSAAVLKYPSTFRAASGGNGVAETIRSTPGAIGYVDDATAKAAGLSVASIKNQDGDYIAPSTAGATAAASQVTPAADLTFHAVWQGGATSYPITYQSWDLVYAKQPNANDAALLKAYLGFLLSAQGQALLAPLNLAPLPANLDQAAVAQLSQITY
jgi:phosphate transport system substrate-binding protein